MKIDPRKLAVDSGYLVLQTEDCTCDGNNEVTDLHRPGCGNIPVITIAELAPIVGIEFKEPERVNEIDIAHGWLVHRHGEHDCVGGDASIPAHEPTCGMTPIVTVEQLSNMLVAHGVVTS